MERGESVCGSAWQVSYPLVQGEQRLRARGKAESRCAQLEAWHGVGVGAALLRTITIYFGETDLRSSEPEEKVY